MEAYKWSFLLDGTNDIAFYCGYAVLKEKLGWFRYCSCSSFDVSKMSAEQDIKTKFIRTYDTSSWIEKCLDKYVFIKSSTSYENKIKLSLFVLRVVRLHCVSFLQPRKGLAYNINWSDNIELPVSVFNRCVQGIPTAASENH